MQNDLQRAVDDVAQRRVTKENPVVVVTGASAGVGRAVVRELARSGARIGLIARGKEGLDAAASEVEEAGSQAVVLPADVADEQAIEQCADEVEKRLGPIDVWINNAMVTVFSPVKEMTSAEYRRVTEVDYLGVVNGTLAALRRMLPRDSGKIVQVSSALGYRAIPLQSAYCAAKHAVVGFTESLRSELIHDGSNVRVTMVHMPALNTPQFRWSRARAESQPQPMPPIFQPEVAARAVTWAAYHSRRDFSVGGSTVQTRIGEKVAPGLLDWFLSRKAYSGQLTGEPLPGDREGNLWQPAQGDHGAHGVFDDEAKKRSLVLEANMHRGPVVLGGVGLLALGYLTYRHLKRTSEEAEQLAEPEQSIAA